MFTHRHDLIWLNISVTPVVCVSVLRDGWSTEELPSWKDVQTPVSGALCFSSGLPMRAGICLGLLRWKGKWRHSVVSDSFRPHGLYSPWDSPGQNTGAGSLSLLQGIISNPKIEPKSPALQADSSPAEPQGKPKNLWVSCIAGGFFTSWAIREAPIGKDVCGKKEPPNLQLVQALLPQLQTTACYFSSDSNNEQKVQSTCLYHLILDRHFIYKLSYWDVKEVRQLAARPLSDSKAYTLHCIAYLHVSHFSCI